LRAFSDCIPILLAALLVALPARAEEITLTVHGDTAAGTLPTYFEPSAFFGWTSIPMKQDFAVDAGVSHGLIVESTQLLLGPSTSLVDYEARLEGLLDTGVGLWDTVAAATRKGSLDADIRLHEASDLAALAATLPQLRAVAFNGGTSARIGRRQLADVSGLALIDLPSSSPAYASLSFDRKREAWLALRAYL